LQQNRWPPTLIANSQAEALARLYSLPGSQYVEPKFSWKYALAPSAIGFVKGNSLGTQFAGDLFVGASRTTLYGGFLFRFKLSADRLDVALNDSRLQDKVADNVDKFDVTESESLLIGKNFGVATDIHTGPDGNLYVVSLSNGAVYKITGKPPTVFVANLTGGQEVPPNNSTATGTATLLLSSDENEARLALNFQGLSSAQADSHIHGPAPPGTAAGVLFPIPNGQLSDFRISLTPQQVQDLKNGLLYINVHSANFPSGEIRGQFGSSASNSSVQFGAATYLQTEPSGNATVTVTRLGNTSGAASVDYRTTDTDTFTVNCAAKNGAAFARCDFATVVGTINFAAGETSKTFSVPIINDGYAEGNETFSVVLSNAIGATLGSPSISTVTISDNETTDGLNPILQTDAAGVSFFVRQHYLDFLGREPEPGEPWSAILNGCSDQFNTNPASPAANCDRIFVSGSFFGSPEFKDKGFYVIDMYRVAFNRLPTYVEFSTDLASISGTTAAEVFAKRAAYATNFVARTEFTNIYGAMSNTTFVNHLMSGGQGQNYNLTSITTRDPASPDIGAKVTLTTADLINRLNAATMTRGQVLRAIAQSDEITLNKEAVNAFVASQYYGYLRRTPDPGGFNSWVAHLTANPNDFRTMVNGFVNSSEYRSRFGPL
jgi:hypothetical protein